MRLERDMTTYNSPPRRENRMRIFNDATVAELLARAADVRESIELSRNSLFLDGEGRRCNPEGAVSASTAGCIRLAAMAMFPDDAHDARDARWQAASAFQNYIGQGIETYEQEPARDEASIAVDIRACADAVATRPFRQTRVC